MKEFSVANLAKIIKAESINNNIGVLTGISIDSRTTKAGDCFFAITGENFDGHDYVYDAAARGAVCVVISKNIKIDKLISPTILKVGDTIKALGDFAREYRQDNSFKVVAITGSAGKTTTRQIVYHVLSQRYRVFASPKNFNNNIGLSLTLLGANPEDQIIIAELGSNNPGEISYLTRIALPDIAVVTNVYPAHIAGFRDMQTIIKEKLSISEGLRDKGILLINSDYDQLVSICRAKKIGFTTFGKSADCDIQAKNMTHTSFGSQLTIDNTQITLPLYGPGNAENALTAWAICSRFGMTIDAFARAVQTMPTIPMRAELQQIGTLTVLNDCYNANPASMQNALSILTNLNSVGKRRLVFICGDMAELGQQSENLHVELGNYIAKAKVKLLLTIGRFAKITAEAAKNSAKYDLQTECFENTVSACNNLEKFIKDYDIILVKGSRVAKLEIAIEKLQKLFS